MQYRETDFNFVSRLMEHEGIYYFFEHENGKHTLVLADSSSAHQPYEGYEKMTYNAQQATSNSQEAIFGWTLEQEVQPGTYALNDFNFEKPKTSLAAQSDIATQNAQSTHAIYDYPGEYGETSGRRRLRKIRIEEMHAQHEVVQGNANVYGLATAAPSRSRLGAARPEPQIPDHLDLLPPAGRQLPHRQQVAGRQSRTVLVHLHRHRRHQAFPCVTRHAQAAHPGAADGHGGRAEGRGNPHGQVRSRQDPVPLGPLRQGGRKLVVLGAGLAVGVGRQEVGAFSLPRVGQEVIVEHLEGDPDLPIVTGQVYNADTMPPYVLPANKTVTAIKTNSTKGGGGFNEIRFEDKKGSEQLFIHGEHDLDVRIKHDRMETIGNDRHLHVGQHKYENVDKDRHEEVGVSHFEKIGTDRNLTVGGKDLVDITADQSLKVGKNVNQEVSGDVTQKVGGKIIITATGDIILKSANSISLNVGGKGILVDQSGVHITGTMVETEATKFQVKSDTSLTLDAAILTMSASGVASLKGSVVKLN